MDQRGRDEKCGAASDRREERVETSLFHLGRFVRGRELRGDNWDRAGESDTARAAARWKLISARRLPEIRAANVPHRRFSQGPDIRGCEQ